MLRYKTDVQRCQDIHRDLHRVVFPGSTPTQRTLGRQLEWQHRVARDRLLQSHVSSLYLYLDGSK